MRIGQGYDVHRLVEGRKLIIGGVDIPYEKGLLGHSDADVLLHAVMDALLGAAALGDIGQHFPDSDERYKGISSIALLKKVGKILQENGYMIENIDSTVIAQRPKLLPYRPQMAENIAAALGIEKEQVSVKATTEEGLGFTGTGEGISAQAIALLSSVADYAPEDRDLILYICGKYMKEQGLLRNNKIVTTVMSNLGLYKALDREGIGYEKTAVGDKYVYENMSRTGNCLGGEQSGHIIFSKYATTGDGILTSLKIMEVMLEKKETLGKLASEVTILPQLLKNVRVADKAAALNDPDVQAAGKAVDEALGNDGRLLLRQSGTEPLIRVMVEAETPEICEKYVDQVIDVLKKKGHVTEG